MIANGRVDDQDNSLIYEGCAGHDLPEGLAKPLILIGPVGGTVEGVSKIGWL